MVKDIINKLNRFFLAPSFLLFFPLISSATSLGTKEISIKVPHSKRVLTAEIYYPSLSDSKAKLQEHGIWLRREVYRGTIAPQPEVPFPLIIFSHGFQGDRFGNSWLAEKLVAQGYIVAMLEHTGNTSYDHNDLFIYTSMWQRPKDVSELLNYLLKHPTWGPLIDQDKIAVIGFSLGGLTALWLGGIEANEKDFKKEMDEKYARWSDWPEASRKEAESVDWKHATNSYYDKRIKAIVALAPDLGQGFRDKGLKKMKLPSLIVVGEQDPVTPKESNANHYAKHIPNAEFALVKNAEHFSFMNQCSKLGQKITPHLCKEPFKEKEKIHQEVSERIIKFLSALWNK